MTMTINTTTALRRRKTLEKPLDDHQPLVDDFASEMDRLEFRLWEIAHRASRTQYIEMSKRFVMAENCIAWLEGKTGIMPPAD